MIIAVDFDGTIVHDCWPDVGRFRFLAPWVLKWLKRRGHVLVLNTCRVGMPLQLAIMKLDDNGIHFDRINENWPARIRQYGGDCRKIAADIYIDDKAIGYWNWPMVFLFSCIIDMLKHKAKDAKGTEAGSK